MRHVSLKRAGRAVLRDVSWQIRPRERWVVTGPNGAGKTQLLKLIAGAIWPTAARPNQRVYWLNGERHSTPAGVVDAVAYLGSERQDRYERYGWNFSALEVVGTGIHRTDIPFVPLSARDRREARRQLARFGIGHLADRRFLTLSYGERRLVLIARALASKPKLLVLDEVMNGLDTARRARLQAWLRSTVRQSLCWVFATHYDEEIPQVATHRLRLDGGRVVSRGKLAPSKSTRTPRRQGVSKGRKLSALRLVESKRSNPSEGRAKLPRPIVKLARASIYLGHARILEDVSLAIRPGECWVVHGGNGSGKTTLLRTLYGDHRVASGGQIERAGIAPGIPLDVFKQRVGFVAPHIDTEYPTATTLLEVVASGCRASIGLNAAMSAADARAAQRALTMFGLTSLAGRSLLELSYGQRRRVLFARACVNAPRLLLLDEALAGVDSATRSGLIVAIDAYVASGGACVLATHVNGDWPGSTTHEVALRSGRAQITERKATSGAVRMAARHSRSLWSSRKSPRQ